MDATIDCESTYILFSITLSILTINSWIKFFLGPNLTFIEKSGPLIYILEVRLLKIL